MRAKVKAEGLRVHVILQARMGSSRLPGKVLAPLGGKPMLGRIIDRISRASNIHGLCVATTDLAEDDPIQDFCKEHLGCRCFRGSSEDVLGRYRECAAMLGSDIVVRATGDNPLVDPVVIDDALEWFAAQGKLDYASFRRGLPLGIGVEVFTRKALERAYAEAPVGECREHVTPYIYRNPHLFCVKTAPRMGEDWSSCRLTVDTWKDRETVEGVIAALGDEPDLSWEAAARYLRDNPAAMRNGSVRQNTVSYAGEVGANGS